MGSASPGAVDFDFEFSFAFQPIVDVIARKVISYEALVRGLHGESSSEVFARVPLGDICSFDQTCRLKAIALAARLGLHTALNLNFLPSSVQSSGECLCATLEVAQAAGIPAERIVFEVSEAGSLAGCRGLQAMFDKYAALGFGTAIDDFGSGLSGLGRLAEYQPNYVKVDRSLVGRIDKHRAKQGIVSGILCICRELSVTPIAEGVERAEEYGWLREAGVRLFQGYYFARPAFEALAEVRQALF